MNRRAFLQTAVLAALPIALLAATLPRGTVFDVTLQFKDARLKLPRPFKPVLFVYAASNGKQYLRLGWWDSDLSEWQERGGETNALCAPPAYSESVVPFWANAPKGYQL